MTSLNNHCNESNSAETEISTSKTNRKIDVPRDEYETALRQITNLHNYVMERRTIGENKKSEQEKTSISADDFIQFSKNASDRMLSDLDNCVEVMNDDEFTRRNIQCDTPLRRAIQQADEPEDAMSVEEYSISSSEDEGQRDLEQGDEVISDEDIDEEDLVDRELEQKARDLRNQVRAKANATQLAREEKLQQHLDKIQQELETMDQSSDDFRQSLVERSSASASGSNDNTNTSENENDDSHHRVRLGELEKSLTALKASLSSLDAKLPIQLNKLQSTIESISHSLKKSGDELSGTERAIHSRINIRDVIGKKSKYDNNGDTSNEKDNVVTPQGQKAGAAKRFAMFVSRS